MAQYDITGIGSALEFDTAIYQGGSHVWIDSTHFALAYAGSGSDGYIEVFAIDGSGNITSAGARLEFDTLNCVTPNLFQVDSTHFLVVWQGDAGDGFAQVMSLNTSTWVFSTIGSAFEFDTDIALDISVQQVDTNHFLAIWAGTATDGFAQILTVDTSTWAVTKEGTALEHDTDRGDENSLVKLDSTHYLACYSTSGSDGFAQVLEVDTSTWAVTEVGTGLEFDTTSGIHISAVTIDSEHVLVFWNGTINARGQARVLAISNSTWNVTAAGAQLEFESSSALGNHNSAFHLQSNLYINAWEASTTTGEVQVFSVNLSTWAITALGTGPLTFITGTTSGGENNLAFKVNDSRFIIASAGDASDGYIQAFDVEGVTASELTVNKSDSITVSESRQVDLAISINVSDSATVTESVSTTLVHNVAVSDSISVTESAATNLIPLISVSDSITVTESLTAFIPELNINVSDSISVTDTPNVAHALQIRVSSSESIDQSNESGAIGIGFGDTGEDRDYMVQGFIPTATSINAIAFYMKSKDGNANIGMHVWIDEVNANSEPQGTVHVGIGGSTKITNATLNTTGLTKYTLTAPVTGLTPGNRYGICFVPWNTNTDAKASSYNDFESSTSNPYANGRRVHGDENFTNWVAPDAGNADILFRTYTSTDGDSVTVSESVSVAFGQADPQVNVSDSVTVSENVSVRLESYVSTSESITVSESLLVLSVLLVSVSDSIEVTEELSLLLLAFIAVSESITVTESVTMLIPELYVTVSDSVSVSENISVNLTLAVAESEEITVTEQSQVDLALAVTVSDSIEVSESHVVDLLQAVNVSESITVTEALTLSGIPNPSVSDTVTVTELVQLLLLSFISVSESITVSESVSIAVVALNEINITVSDEITVSESVATTLVHNVTTSDSITIAESLTAQLILSVSVSDSVTVSESVALDEEITLAVSDTITLTEASTVVVPLTITVSESVTVTESLTLDGVPNITTSDAISVSESFAVLLLALITVSDSIEVTESVEILLLALISVSESITVTENVVAVLSDPQITVSDTITVTENSNVAHVLQIKVSDSIEITESLEAELTDIETLRIQVYDMIGQQIPKFIIVDGQMAMHVTGIFYTLL